MSGGGKRSVGPPMSKFWSDLQIPDEQTSVSDKRVYEPLCLCTPIPIRRDLKVTERVPFGTEPSFGLRANKNPQRQG